MWYLRSWRQNARVEVHVSPSQQKRNRQISLRRNRPRKPATHSNRAAIVLDIQFLKMLFM